MVRGFTLLVAALVAGSALADTAADASRGYTLEGSATPPALKVGESGKVAVTIRPKAPTWHVHPQAPLKVLLEAPAGLELARPELGRKDVADPKGDAPRLETTFLATAAGPQQVRAKVDFFLCSDTACVKQVKDVATAVTVQ